MADSFKLREDIFSCVPGLAVMEKLFDGLEDSVFCIKERGGRYVAVNRAFVQRLGLPNKEAAIGRTAHELFPALLAANYERQDDLVFSTNHEIRDVLEMNPNGDGSIGWYLAQKIPLCNARQQVVALVGASQDLKLAAASDSDLKAVSGVIDEIQKQYAKPLRIGGLAKRAGIPMSRLERMMQRVFGLSPRQFLIKTRIVAAAGYLESCNASLGDIAVRCGFYDQAEFCRQFRKAMGLTPRQHRQAHLPAAREALPFPLGRIVEEKR